MTMVMAVNNTMTMTMTMTMKLHYMTRHDVYPISIEPRARIQSGVPVVSFNDTNHTGGCVLIYV